MCDLLADQFNGCMNKNKYTEVLKLTKVLPCHKSGDRDNAGNFRPISLLPIISKDFEKILFERIEDFLNVKKVQLRNQYGFRSKE